MTTKYTLKTQPSHFNFQIDYPKELNPSQCQVVTEGDGACLVLAGAGSGKTRTLIYRVAYLLEKGVAPHEILLVTFTNKAANEMKNRVEVLLGAKSKGLWCGTFHHIGNRVLRMYAKHIDLRNDFGILDDEDSRDLIKAAIKSLDQKASEVKFPKPAVVQNILSFAVNSKESLSSVVTKNYPYFINFLKEFEKIKFYYEDKKKRTSHLDYDDLLLKWSELLDRSDEVRTKLTQQFRYCLIDEYQDTNKIQHEIVQKLSSHHKNILVVGDDAQSIYSFRAARIKNILDFPEFFENTKIFKLETNYRSTRSILNLANESIKHNIHQFPKALKSVGSEGVLPQVVKLRDARQEATFIAQRIGELCDAGYDLSQIAVLFRAHYQAAQLELELAKRGTSYVVRGGIRFFEQAHVKDVLAFLKIIQNPADELAWTRALTLQPGIGPGYAEKIFVATQKVDGDFEKIMASTFSESFPPRVRDGFLNFKKIFGGLLKESSRNHPDLLIEEVLEKGYNKYVLVTFDNAQDRLEDLKQLVNFAHTYKKLEDFLADVTLRENFKGETIVEADSQKNDTEELVLSTIHQAKGLEWSAVFVMGLSEGQFPHERSMKDEESLEEERRLFYVAVTRAKEELFLTHPMTRYDFNAGTVINRPSIFIEELPNRTFDEVEIEEEATDEETIYLE